MTQNAQHLQTTIIRIFGCCCLAFSLSFLQSRIYIWLNAVFSGVCCFFEDETHSAGKLCSLDGYIAPKNYKKVNKCEFTKREEELFLSMQKEVQQKQKLRE